jgi:hypothetical protein
VGRPHFLSFCADIYLGCREEKLSWWGWLWEGWEACFCSCLPHTIWRNLWKISFDSLSFSYFTGYYSERETGLTREVWERSIFSQREEGAFPGSTICSLDEGLLHLSAVLKRRGGEGMIEKRGEKEKYFYL